MSKFIPLNPVYPDASVLDTTDGKGQPEQAATDGAATGRGPLAESMLQASIDSILAIDKDLKITAWNEATVQWSGYSYEEVVGKNLFEVFPHAKKIDNFEASLYQALEGRRSFLPALYNIYLPGHFEVHIMPLKDKQGNITGVLQILHDVAHRLHAENELKNLNCQLVLKNNALTVAHEELALFAKISAHDLKEPLRKIYTFAELITMHDAPKLSSMGRANFRRIQKSVQRMRLLIDDIVNFSELSRSSVTEAVDLNSLLTAELERNKEEISQAGAVIKSRYLPVIKNGYAVALTQMLRQLLSNAIKFRKPGMPLLVQVKYERVDGSAVTGKPTDSDAQYHHIYVIDNGIGFDPQYYGRIFELFQRLHPNGTYGGNGVGLALAQKALRMHNGFIKAESSPDRGSVFHCFIPAL